MHQYSKINLNTSISSIFYIKKKEKKTKYRWESQEWGQTIYETLVISNGFQVVGINNTIWCM